mgnify:CR=1 FL=1
MSKELELNKVVKINTIKELMDLSVKDAANQIAFEFRDEKDKENCSACALRIDDGIWTWLNSLRKTQSWRNGNYRWYFE